MADEQSTWPKKRLVHNLEFVQPSDHSESHVANYSALNDSFNDRNSVKTMEERDSNNSNWSTCGCYVPKRYIVTVLLGLGMLLVYAMRTNVGVTVVMILDERAFEKVGSIDSLVSLPVVKWDSQMVGFLHSVFYIGYIITQLPGALFTTLCPSYKIYGGCILISSLLNLLLPVCIDNDLFSLTCIVRCCQGLSEGMLYPACYGVLRLWTAPSERSRQVAAVLSCAYAGAILGFPMAGVITHYLRWQYIFYISGSLCIVWFVSWLCLVYEKPSHHCSISDEEFDFMQKSQGEDVIDYENIEIPWRSILTSLPVLSICLCHFVRQWVLGLMLTNEALYLNEFGFNIAETGVLASIPHIVKVILSFSSGYIADCLLNSSPLSTTAVRKLFVAIGFGVQSIGFIILAFMTNGTAVVIVLTIAVGALGLTTSGWSVNHYDLSTRYASSLVAVSSTFGCLGAIIVPLATGSLTTAQTVESWSYVFYLTASIVIFAAVFYLIFGTGEQQSWSNPPPHIELIQKTDPLARKPYSTHKLQDKITDTDPVLKDKTQDSKTEYGSTDSNNEQTEMSHKLTKHLMEVSPEKQDDDKS
ncbi:hypothetical protein ACF0H5_015749 [Mactra antiquata]